MAVSSLSPRAVHPLRHRLDVTAPVPGSKSHTNRALVCAALATGTSRLAGALFAEDTLAMVETLRELGSDIVSDAGDASMRVSGTGGRLRPGPARLNVRQSGTTGRFVLPMLTLGEGRYELDGDPQLRSRPFGDLVDALGSLGAKIEGTQLPLHVMGGTLDGGQVSVSGSVSSQFLSGLLLSAPGAASEVELSVDGALVSRPYIDLTLSTMASFSAVVERDAYRRFVVAPTGYQAASVMIEPDASAASYFFGAAAISGGRVTVDGLGTNTVQGDMAFVDVLERMGCTVERSESRTTVIGPEQLSAVTVDMADFSDTAQTLAVVATFADAPSELRGIGFIRHKETDRIGAVATELARRGIAVDQTDDSLVVHPGQPTPGVVETYDDHRMAMSFALLGLCHPGIEIADPGCVAKTFPNFFAVLDTLTQS